MFCSGLIEKRSSLLLGFPEKTQPPNREFRQSRAVPWRGAPDPRTKAGPGGAHGQRQELAAGGAVADHGALLGPSLGGRRPGRWIDGSWGGSGDRGKATLFYFFFGWAGGRFFFLFPGGGRVRVEGLEIHGTPPRRVPKLMDPPHFDYGAVLFW